MKGDLKDWRDVWHKPLIYDGVTYVWATNRIMAITFIGLTDRERFAMVDKLNGKGDFIIHGLFRIGVDFHAGGDFLFCVRGWGNMTGRNGMQLDNETARKLQESFVKYILKKLST